MRLTIAYSKIKKRNLVLINNDTYQRETLSEQPIRQLLNLEEVFYLLQNMAPNSKAIDNVAPLCMPGTAVDWLWLLRKAVVYNCI